jgi:hypothetical protein
MVERVLKQGEVVKVEFDRAATPLGLELSRPGALEGELAATAAVLPPHSEPREDYSLGAYVVEFIIAATSGIASDLFVEMVKAAVERRAAKRGAVADVMQSTTQPDDPGIHLEVRIVLDRQEKNFIASPHVAREDNEK